MREGDGGVNSSRYQKLLVVCWVALVFGGGRAEEVVANLGYMDPRLFVGFVVRRVVPLVTIGAEGLNETAEGTSSKSQSVSAVFDDTAGSRLPNSPKPNRCPPLLSNYSQPAHPTRLNCPIPPTPRCSLPLIPYLSGFWHLAAVAAAFPKLTSQPASYSSTHSHPR
jgi:hypothetical protein